MSKTNLKPNIADYLVVLLAPIIAALVTIVFNTSQVVSLLFFFILPALYLTIRDPRFLKKGLIIILAGIPFTIIIDYFAIRDNSWWVNTIFPIRLLNGIPIEDFIWVASWFYYIIIFYEHFIDRHRSQGAGIINRKYKTLLAGWFGALAVLLIFYLLLEKYLFVPYFYFIFAILLGMIPLCILLVKRPWFLGKFSRLVIYFFYINFLHEVSALQTNQWTFPGEHFVGWVQIFQFRFPFEEFALWMILGATYLVTWFEYFIDDTK